MKVTLESILEEIRKNLGKAKMKQIEEDEAGAGDATSAAPVKKPPLPDEKFDTGSGAGGAELNAAPKPNPASGAETVKGPAPINPGAEARANIGDNSLGGDDTPDIKINAPKPNPASGASTVQGPTPVAAAKGEGATGKALAASGISRENRRDQAFVDKTLGAGKFKAGSAESNLALQKSAAQKPAAAPASAPSGSSAGRQAAGAELAKQPEPGFDGDTVGKSISQAADVGAPAPLSKDLAPKAAAPAPKPAAGPAPKPAAAAPRPAGAPEPAAQPKSAQMFQASNDEGGGGSAASFFAADKQRQREASAPAPRPAAAAPRPAAPAARPAPAPSVEKKITAAAGVGAPAPLAGLSPPPASTRSNVGGGKLGFGLRGGQQMQENFEQFCKSFLVEQRVTPEKMRKQERLKIDIGSEKHDPTSPNQSHIQEAELDEAGLPISVGIGANRRAKKKTSFAYTSLGGNKLQSRSSAHRQGNQKMGNRYESVDINEVRKLALKKVNEKKNEVALGSTATGKRGETIDTEPTKPELTGYH